MKIKVTKFKDNIKLPERKHYNDTGADIYMPCDGFVEPFKTVVVPLGFGIDLPDGYNAHIQVRTSIATKGIIIQQCAIDAGYKGELHMILTNASDEEFVWAKGERLGYIEITPCQYTDFVLDLGDKRGTKAFGSTNT